MSPIRIAQISVVALAAIAWLAQLFIPGVGMNFVTGLVVYLIVWWLALFTILPIGVRGQAESGDVVAGTESGAPVSPDIRRKAWMTTVLAAVIWLVLFVVLEFRLISLEHIPFLIDAHDWDA